MYKLMSRLRYAISVIEIPVEIKPDGTYVQLTDRMRIEFRKTDKLSLPSPQPPPKTVDWFKIFGPPEPDVNYTDVEPESEPMQYDPETTVEEVDLADIEPVYFNVVKRQRNPDGPITLRRYPKSICDYSRRAL
jgi:hypothetical protein